MFSKKKFTPLRAEQVDGIFLSIVNLENRTDINPADISWQVKYNPRARRMILRYHQGVATITLPRFADQQHLTKFLHHSLDWLQKEIVKEKKFQQDNILASGKTISVMGQQKTLHFVVGNGRVRAENGTIIVPGNDSATQQKKLKKYLWRLAEKDFPAVVFHYCNKLNMQKPAISIRDPKTRWGSCIQKKDFFHDAESRIMLSFRLTLAPPLVLAYLAAHEACHLREANHGKKFWHLVETIFPNYEIAEQWLKNDGKKLMMLF